MSERTEQAISASVGAVLISALTTPLEVLKVRQQAASTTESASLGATVTRMVRHEGAASLWSGLQPTLLMSVPGTVLYLTAYEEARNRLAKSSPLGAAWAPLVAGGGARAVVATVSSPLELLRTRMQATAGADGLAATAARAVRAGGVSSLWTGLTPTLLRDVPFSCVYWSIYESLRRRAKAAHPQQQLTTSASFAAGAVAGSIAALVTTPLDVIKTRQQLLGGGGGNGGAPLSVLGVARSEGVAALFAGVVPRLARVAPANAIMIASYELGKRHLHALFDKGAGYSPAAVAAANSTAASSSNAFAAVVTSGGGRDGQRVERHCPIARHVASSLACR